MRQREDRHGLCAHVEEEVDDVDEEGAVLVALHVVASHHELEGKPAERSARDQHAGRGPVASDRKAALDLLHDRTVHLIAHISGFLTPIAEEVETDGAEGSVMLFVQLDPWGMEDVDDGGRRGVGGRGPRLSLVLLSPVEVGVQLVLSRDVLDKLREEVDIDGASLSSLVRALPLQVVGQEAPLARGQMLEAPPLRPHGVVIFVEKQVPFRARQEP
mmetsp:Transcript_50938/g.119771  ORF Transcript_50938/g.119771 Transcript_50938/m.119771 type:complete len:216 (-) Transcript_50938:416-1063(-)